MEWNEERISALKQLWSEGMSASQVEKMNQSLAKVLDNLNEL